MGLGASPPVSLHSQTRTWLTFLRRSLAQIFWLIAIICLPLAVVSAIVTPSTAGMQGVGGRKPKFDYLGTFLMIASFVLLIYGMTEGNVGGWDTAKALAPMLIGIALFPAFLWWETRMDPIDALIDPKIWRIRNVVLISVVSLLPYFWCVQTDCFASSLSAVLIPQSFPATGGSSSRSRTPRSCRSTGTTRPS